MVDLQSVGMGLTLILLATSAFIGAVAIQEDNSFGFNEAIDKLTIGEEDLSLIHI